MVMSVCIGAVTGIIFLISICFCIGDLEATAATTTGVPLIQIFYDSTGSKVGTCFLSSLIVCINLLCASALQVGRYNLEHAFEPFTDSFLL